MAAQASQNVLGTSYRTQDLELHPGRRRLSQGTQRRQFMDDSDPRPAGLFLAAPSNPVVQLCRSSKRHEFMASGALPPALPMVKIGPHHFSSAAIASTPPLHHIL